MSLRVKNNSGATKTWLGQSIDDQEYYSISESDRSTWIDDTDVFTDIASGDLVINDGTEDLTDPVEGYKVLQGKVVFPISDIDNRKISVHTSYKPHLPDSWTYAIWSGAGDDANQTPSIGAGELLSFQLEPGKASHTIDIKFDPTHGRVWMHEAYLKFAGAGHGDYIIGDVVCEPSLLQTSVDLVGNLVDGWLIPYDAVHNPVAPTHGFAATPTLVPRSYSKDGEWNWDAVNGLTPAPEANGLYRIADSEKIAHRYFNKIPVYGESPYFTMTSDETTEIHPGYFIRATAHNVSDTNWHACIMMEIYRQRTHIP